MSSACWMTRSSSFSWEMEEQRDRFPWSSAHSSGTARLKRRGQSRAAPRTSRKAAEKETATARLRNRRSTNQPINQQTPQSNRKRQPAADYLLLCPFCRKDGFFRTLHHGHLLLKPLGARRSCFSEKVRQAGGGRGHKKPGT